MAADKKTHITELFLVELEKSSGVKDLATQQDFDSALKLDVAIIYLLVDWSGPERVSRYIVFRAINEINKKLIPTFKIDCSDQQKQYVVDWLFRQSDYLQQFYFGGWGETVLLSSGKIIDFIKNPGQLGFEKTIEKIEVWNNTAANSGLALWRPDE